MSNVKLIKTTFIKIVQLDIEAIRFKMFALYFHVYIFLNLRMATA